MCDQCVRDHGGLAQATPEIIAAARAIERAYEFAPTGGRGHVVLDDYNVGDEIVDWCLGPECDQYSDRPEEDAAVMEALRLVRALPSERERATAIHLAVVF